MSRITSGWNTNATCTLKPTKRFSMKCSDGLYRDPDKLESYFQHETQGAFITAMTSAMNEGLQAMADDIAKEMSSK